MILVNSFLLVSAAPQTSGLSQALCSSDNTGSSSAVGELENCNLPGKFNTDLADVVVTNDYMSNGRCFDTCKANYAFAIVQYQSCWCSNYAPAQTSSTGSCNENCPGYPFEKCGSQSGSMFGYIALNKSPSGTLGASSTSVSNTPTSAQSSSSQTVSFHFLRSFSSFPLPSTQDLSSIASTLSQVSSTTSSSTGSSTSVQQSSTISLIPSGPSSPPTPSPVTVQETVTASPSVLISLISIVCINPSSSNRLLRCGRLVQASSFAQNNH